MVHRLGALYHCLVLSTLRLLVDLLSSTPGITVVGFPSLLPLRADCGPNSRGSRASSNTETTSQLQDRATNFRDSNDREREIIFPRMPQLQPMPMTPYQLGQSRMLF